ncbi:hypothetical protein GYMLUDRAFT_152439, partial [Collybiopsis luxurians FD-317 M1]
LRNQLTDVVEAASKHSSRVAFKIPHVNEKTNEIENWQEITYYQYLLVIEQFASYWFHVLNDEAGIPQRSVIAVCPRGYRYINVLHVYGISRAGYIFQLINIFPTANYDVIRGPFELAKTGAFIFKSLYKDVVRDIPIPCYQALSLVDATFSSQHPLPGLPKVEEEDTGIIFQTSGTTSGASKIVPGSYSWLDAVVRKSIIYNKPSTPNGQDVFAWR